MSFYDIAKYPTIFLTLLLTGCAMAPGLKSDEKIKLTKQSDSVCITSNPDIARKCALYTIAEISDGLQDAGNYDRGSAYAALGLGTLTGAALGFKAPEDAVKGLAVLSGTLLGLNSVVNSNGQKSVLEKGLKDAVCLIRAFDAVQASSVELKVSEKNFTKAATQPSVRTLSASGLLAKLNIPKETPPEQAAFLKVDASIKAARFEEMTASLSRGFTLLSSAQSAAATELSVGIINVRAEVRKGLAGTVGSSEDILKSQEDRIVAMTGAIIKKRAEMEKKADTPTDGSPEQEGAVNQAKEFVAGTAPVAAAAQGCVSPATQRELER